MGKLDAKLIRLLLKHSENKGGQHNLCSEWLSMNENVAHTKVLNFTNVMERYLFKIRCKRENKASKNANLTGDNRETRN